MVRGYCVVVVGIGDFFFEGWSRTSLIYLTLDEHHKYLRTFPSNNTSNLRSP